MKSWTLLQKSAIVELFFINQNSNISVQKTFKVQKKFRVIHRYFAKFRSGQGQEELPRSGKSTVVSAINIIKVVLSLKRNLKRSLKPSFKQRSQQLNLRKTSLQKILNFFLKICPNKIQIVQKIFKRRNKISGKLIQIDEAHFSLEGIVNKQNI